MKQIIPLFFLIFLILTGCNKDDEEILLTDTGIVVDYAGAGDCGYVIELDNGNKIQPLYFPEGFTFSNGQRVLVDYVELQNVISSCDRGLASDIKYIEELNCAAYVDLYFSNYDSLARDPVFIHEAFVDGNCLQIKISYSGGCEAHTIDLAYMHPWVASSTNIPTFEIRHDANGDLCEAFFTKEFRFDLTPLILAGKKEFVLTAKLTDGTAYNKIFEIDNL